MIKKTQKFVILTSLFLFLIMFSNIIPFLKPIEFDNYSNLKTSTDNYLFNGKEYDMTLDDVYDDEDPYKVYTGANFSYVFMENESTTFNEIVSPVNNSEKQLGDPLEFTTPYGTSDDLDNMQEYDGDYTSFYSTDLPATHHEMPVQFTDFAYTYGTSGGIAGTGSTEFNDATNYAYMNSASYISYGSETYLGYIVPDTSDIYANWNEGDGAPHYNKLDEYTSVPDGGNIRESSTGVNDRWNFGTLTLPANALVSKFVVWGYCLRQAGKDVIILLSSNCFTGTQYLVPQDSSYSWKSRTITTSVSADQTALNGFYLNVVNGGGEFPGYVDLESIYVQVYYTTQTTYYRHNSQITFDYAGGDIDYLDTLYYDFATTVAIDMDLDIYDWVGLDFDKELQSNSQTGYVTSNFDLTSDGGIYVSETNQIRVRFETSGTTATDFDVRIDQLMFDYVLTTDAYPELEAIMETTFSNYNDPDILGIEVESYHRTDVAQTITFSIYNYNTINWETITSYSQTSFTQSLFQSTSVSDYFDSGTMKIRYYGTSTTQDFDLFVDNLNITITYKMDLSHSITFETNGLWKYRWILFGSISYTDWTYFEVVDPTPNFFAISESEVTTRWILQEAGLTAVEDFNDDINTDYWNLVDVSIDNFSYTRTANQDSFTEYDDPNNNNGGDYLLWTSDATNHYTHSYYQSSAGHNYLISNSSDNNYLNVYASSSYSSMTLVDLYAVESFTESTITWNNDPDTITQLLDDASFDPTQAWNELDLGTNYDYTSFRLESAVNTASTYIESSEYWYDRAPHFDHWQYKNYFGSGYMYMQTNTAETIGLQSQDYGTHKTLSSGDYFEVDFQTSSDSKIDLILIKDGVVNKTLTLSQSGNTNFNRHTVQLSVDEEVEFDQLKISSSFGVQDYASVYDIKTYKYTISGDSADFYISPNNQREVYLSPESYNLRIFEEGTKKIDTTVSIGSNDVYYIYTPTPTRPCRIALYSPDDIYLPLTDYHIYINRSLNGEYNRFALLGDLFYVDDNSSLYIYMDIYDRFDTLIESFTELPTDYLDLELEVYQLQIKNLMEAVTTLDINSSFVYPLLSGEKIEFMLASTYYEIGYYDDDNDYQQFSIFLGSNQAYELNRSKICFLSYADQQGNHLSFENYKTYINDTLIYENVFYEDAGDHVNITITDRYDFQVYTDVYVVTSGDNYIPITLTMYSLKVMNQQENFNHINITRDPNYYESEYYWSEWIAPNEIIEFRLFAGYYKINLTDNENSGSSFYAYNLSGNAILLISSDNIISNVIYNIENVNTTIGNQITNVQIDLTNQNSDINNTIINIEINLSNVNSSLGDLLVNMELDITNIENNISTLYVFTENSFVNLNNSIDTYFISIDTQIISINETISNLVIGVDNSIYLINGTISTLISSMENNLLLMNVSIDTALFDLGITIEQIGSNITTNYILLNNSITLTNNNINTTAIGIINNLLIVNNTISDLITSVYTSVYLINNSIYTAVVDLGTYLSLMNNTITGDISIVLEMNEFLTEMYQTTMFSELLNWTNIAGDTTLFEEQVDVWSFINDYKDTSAIVELRYEGIIEELLISAQNTIDQYLPSTDVEYRIWSVANEEYLSEWEALPENKTISFGFYEAEIPYDPEPLVTTFTTYIIAILFFVGLSLGALKLYYTAKNQKSPIPPELLRYMNKKPKNKNNGAVDDRL